MPSAIALRRRARARARALTLTALRPTPPPPEAAAPTSEWQDEPGKRVEAASRGPGGDAVPEWQDEPGKRVEAASRGRRAVAVDARVARVAERQHALLTTQQARRLGLGQSSLDRRVRAGRLEFVHPGVLRMCGVPVTWEQRVLAACLCAGDEAMAARRTAGQLWKLDGVSTPLRPEVLVPIAARARSSSFVVATTDQLLRADRARIGGIPCTSIDRTLCDLAAFLSPDALELVVEDALRRSLTTVDRLRWRNEMLSGRRGTKRLRRLLDSRSGERPPESQWEVRLLQLLRRAGLPEPLRQLDVFDDDGRFVGRVDLAYPDRRLGIEFDSNRWHSGRVKVDEQSARRNRFTVARWRLLHVTSTAMSDPSAVVALVACEHAREV